MKTFFLVLALLCLTVVVNAQTTYINISGAAMDIPSNWTTDGTVSGTPASNFTTNGDVFNLSNSPGVLSAAWTLGAVTLNITTPVTFGSGKAVILQGTTATSNSNLTFSAAGNTLTVGDGVSATSLTMTAGNLSFSNATATLTINFLGVVDMQGAASAISTYTPASVFNNGIFKTKNTATTPFPTGKDFTAANTTTGSVEFYNTAAQTIIAGTYYDLVTSGSGVKIPGVITVKHQLNVGAGTTLSPVAATVITGTGATLTGSGAITVSSTAAAPLTAQYNFSSYALTGLTVDYNSVTAQNIAATATVGNYGYLKATATTSGTKTLLGDITVLGDITITASSLVNVLDVSASNYTITVGGNWNVSGTGATVFNGRAGTVIFNGSAAQSIVKTGTTALPNFFSLQNSNTSATLTLSNNTTVAGDLTIDNNATISAGATTLTVAGNWTNSGSFASGTGTVVLAGTTGSHTLSGSMTGANAFANVTVTATSPATWSFGTNAADVTGNFILSGTGTITAPSTTLQLGGSFTHTAGVFTHNGGIINLNGSAAQALTSTIATAFNTLSIDNASSRTITPSGTISVANALTIPSGITFSMGATALTLANDYTNNGVFTSGTSTVTFSATGTGRIIDGNLTGSNKFYNIVFDGVGGAWQFGSGGATAADVANNFTITNGAVTAPSSTLAIGGNFSNSGTFTHNSGTVSFNSTTVTQTIAAVNFNNLVLSGTTFAKTISSGTNVAGDLAITTTTGAVSLGAANVAGSMSVTATSGVTTLGGNLDVDGDINVTGTTTAGIFDVSASNYRINIGGSWTVANTSTATTLFQGRAGTVVFDGTGTQTISKSAGTVFPNFFHIQNSNTLGSVVLGSNTTVTGNLINDAGATLNPDVNTLTITGNFTNDGIYSPVGAQVLAISGNLTNTGTFTSGSGATAVSIGGSYANSGIFNSGTGTVIFNGATGTRSVSGSLTGTNGFNNLSFTLTTPATISFGANAADIAANFSITGTGTVTASSATTKVGGNFTHSAGTFLHNNGVVELNGTSGQTMPGVATTFYDLNISNGTGIVTGNAATTISHALISAAASNLNMTTFTLAGGFTATANAGLLQTQAAAAAVPAAVTWGGTVSFNSITTAQAVPAGAYNNLKIIGTTAAKTTGGAITVAADFVDSTTTGITLLGGALSVAGDVLIAGAATNSIFDVSATNYQVSAGGDWSVYSSGVATSLINGRAGTIVFNGSGAQLISSIGGSALPNFFNLQNSNTTTAVSLGSNTTLSGSLTIDASAELDCGATTLSIGSNYVNNGKLTAGTGTLAFTATTTGKTLGGNMTGTSQFNNITFSGAGGAWSFGANNADVAGNFTISAAGTVTAPSTTLKVAGSFAHNAGTFTHNSGTVNLNGISAQAYPGSVATTFATLTIDNANTRTLSPASAVTVVNSFTLPSGITLSMGAVGMTCNSNFTNNGTFSTTGAQALSVAGDFANAGTFTNTGAQLTTIGGNYNNSGTFTAGSGTVTFNSAATGRTLTGSMKGANKFNNLTFNNATGAWSFGANTAEVANAFTITNGAVTAPSSTLIITGTFARTGGSFLHNNGTVEFNGAAQTIPGAATTFYDVNLSNASGFVTANAATTISHALTTVAGNILNMTTFSLAGTFSATALSGTLQTQCTLNPVPASVTWGGTVSFNSSTIAQPVTTGTYNYLKIIGTTGAKTTSGAITVAADLIDSTTTGITTLGGTLDVNGNIFLAGLATNNVFDVSATNYQVNVAGNWSVYSSGAATALFNGRAGSVVFDGTGSQSVLSAGGSASPNFFSFRNSNVTTPVTLNATTAITGNLTIDLGATLTTAASTLNLSGNFVNNGTYSATGAQALNVGGSWTNNGTFSAGSGTVSFTATAAGKTLGGSMTGSNKFNNLSFTGASPGAWSFGSSAAEVAGNFTMSGTGTVTAPSTTLQVTGNFAHNAGTFTHNGGAVVLNATGVQAFPGSLATIFGTLTLDNTNVRTLSPSAALAVTNAFTNPSNVTLNMGTNGLTCSGTFTNNGVFNTTAAQITTVNSDFTNTGTFVCGTGATALTVKGSYNNSGTFTAGTGTVVFNSTTTGKTLSGTMTGASKFNNITFNSATGAWSFGANNAEVGGAFTITTGTVTAPSTTLLVAGNFVHTAGTFTHNSGTVNMNGAGAQALPGTATTFSTLTFDNTTRTITNNAATTVAAAFTIPSNITFSTAANALACSSDLTVNGTYSTTGAQALTVAGNLTNAGTMTNAGAQVTTVAGNFTNSGSFNNANAAQVTTVNTNFANSGTYVSGNGATALTIKGNYNNTGTFTAGTGTVVFSAATTGKTLSGTMTGTSKFNNITFNNAAGAWSFGANPADVGGAFTITTGSVTAPSTTLQVAGNFVHTAGTFTHNSGTVNMNGAGAQTLPATATTFNVLSFDNTARTITNNAAATVAAAFTIPSNITFSTAANALTCSSDLTVNGTYSTTGAQALTVAGNLTNAGTMTNTGAQVTTVTGNFTNSGSFNNANAAQVTTVNTDFTNSGTYVSGNGATALTLKGNYNNTGTFTAGTGTVVFSAATTGKTLSGTMTGASKFNNITFNNAAGAWSFGANAADVGGAFTITTGAVTAPSTTLQVAGNFVHTAGTFTHNSGTVNMNGAGAQTLPATATTFNVLSFDNTARTITNNAATTVVAAFTIPSNVTFSTAANALTCSSDITVNGTYSTTGAQALSVAGNLSNTGTMTNTGAQVTTVTGNFTNSGSFNNANAAQVTTVNTDFANSGTYVSGNGATALTVKGSYDNTGTFTAGTGTVVFNAVTTGKTLTGTMTGTSKFNNITFNSATGAWSFGANSAEVGGIFTITNGAVTAPSANLKLTGNFAHTAGTFSHNNGTVEFVGAAQTMPGTATTFYDVNISNASGFVTANAATTIDHALTTAAGSYLNMAALRLLGSFTATGHSGTLLSQCPTATSPLPLPAGVTWGGTVSFNAGTTAQTVPAGSYNNLKFIGTTSTKTTGGAVTVAASFIDSTTSGIATLGGTLNVRGNVNIFGTTTNNILSLGSNSFNVGGNWTIFNTTTATGLLNGGTGTVIFDGSSAQTISSLGGTALPNFFNLTNGNTSAILTVNTNTNVTGTFSVTASAIVEPAAAVVFNTGAAAGTISGSGTIKVTRSAATADYSNQYKFATNTLTALTVDYAAAAAQNVNSFTYGTLKTSGIGIKTAQGNLTINNLLNIGSGTTLDMGATNILLAGSAPTYSVTGTLKTAVLTATTANPLPAGATWVGSGIVEYAALSGAQTVVAGTYNNLSLDNTSGTNAAGGTITVNGTFAIGKIALGANNIVLGSSASIAGASSANYAVTTGAGVVRKLFTGNGSFSYPVGDVTNYTPVTLAVTGSAYSSAYAEAKVTAAKEPHNGGSNNFLNRYWTVNTSGITAPSWSVTSATYVPGDITGTESLMSAASYTGALPWTKYGTASANTLSTTAITAASAAISAISTAVPGISVAPPATAFCSGGSQLLTASGTGDGTLTYTWSPSSGLSATTGASVTASPSTGATPSVYIYTVTVTDANGSTASAAATITVNPIPAAITGTMTVCESVTTTLSSATNGGVWSTADATVTVGSATGIVTGISAGTTAITYALVGGCSVFATVTVNQAPTAISGTATVCEGSTTALSSTPATGTWSSSNLSQATIGSSSGIVSGLLAGTSSITYTLANSCRTARTVTVNAVPSAISGTATVCEGLSTTFTNDDAGGTWSSSNGSIATVGSATGLVSGVLAGVADISYTLASGCYTTATLTVDAVPLAITGTLQACEGNTSALANATALGTWSTTSDLVATIGSADGLVTAIAHGTEGITYTLPTGCFATAIFTVNAVPANIAGNSSVCEGGTTSLSNATISGSWSSSNTGIATVGSASGVVTGIAQGVAVLTYALPGGCASLKTLTVNPSPAAITGTAVVCRGLTTTLANAVPSGVWTTSNAAVATVGSASGIVTGAAAGVANITYTLAGSCSVVRQLTVNPLPASITGTPIVCEGLTTTLASATSGGSWLSSNISAATVGSASGVVSAVAAGNTTISYILPTGCQVTSIVTVNGAPAGIVGASSVCSGFTTTFTNATGGGSWSGSNLSVATVGSATGLITGVSSGNTIITYTLPNGCFAIKSFTVNPDAAVITGPTMVCEATSSVLASVSGGGIWTSSNTSAATIGSSSGVITGVSSGFATITYTLPAGCLTTVAVTVNPSPANIAGAAIICENLTTTFTNSVPGGNWTSGNGSVATVDVAGVVSGVVAGATRITYTLPGGCYSSKSLTVTAVPGAISGLLTVCEGTTSALGNATPTGTWSSGATDIASVTLITGVVSGNTVGTATITYSLGVGCSVTTEVTVNPQPYAGIVTGASSVGEGASISLSDTTSGGVWSASNANASVDAFGVVSGVTEGTVTISYAVTNGCGTAVAPYFITVSAASSGITGIGAICQGSTSTLSHPVAGGTWTSANSGIASVGSATGVVTGVTTGTTTISYVASGNTYTTIVTVQAALAGITGTASACLNKTTTLAHPTPGGTWTTNNPAIATVDAGTGVVSAVGVGTTYITYTFGTGCYRTILMTVKALPAAISGNTNVCVGSATTLTDATPVGVSWTSSTPSVATIGSASGVVTGIASGTATITYLINTGCVATTIFTVGAAPQAITGTFSACVGATQMLSDADAGGTWTSSTVAKATIGSSSGIVTGIAAGTSLISYTMPGGCRRTQLVTINALPNAITGTTTICSGSTSALASTTTGGTWSSGNTGIATVGTSGIVTGIGVGSAVISYTIANSCSVRSTVNVGVSVNAISGTATVCNGSTTSLANTTPGGTWSSAAAATASVSIAGLVTGVAAGTTTITYTISAGCRSTRIVTVNQAPAAVTGPTSVCINLGITLADAIAGGTWTSSNPSLGSINASSGAVAGIAAGTPIMTYSVANGCYKTYAVTVKSLPAAITGQTAICIGSPRTLSDVTSGGVSWVSSTPSVATIGSVNGVVTGVSNGTATITYNVNTGCYATTVVTINTTPSAGVITGPSTVVIANVITLGNTTGGGTWSSSNTGIATVNASSGDVTGAGAGLATITYTANNGCGVATTTQTVSVTASRSADNSSNSVKLAGGGKFVLYPNPTSGAIIVEAPATGLFTIATIEGQVAAQLSINAGINSLSIPKGLAAGIYMCRYTGSNGGTVVVRVVYEP